MYRNPLARLAARAARLLLALLLVSLAVPVAPSPLEAKPRAARRGQGQARLIIITNFDATEIEIGKTSYPYEYIFGDQQGIGLQAQAGQQGLGLTDSQRQAHTAAFERQYMQARRRGRPDR